MDIKGAVALIAGGGGGFGAATARRLHAHGAHVVIADQNAERGTLLADELGERATFVAADVTDPDAVQAAVDVARVAAPRSFFCWWLHRADHRAWRAAFRRP